MNGLSLSTIQRTRINILRSVALLFLCGVCISQPPWAPDAPVHRILASSGIIATFIAIVGRMWSILYLGGRKSTILVTDGPYSITRNPLYFFSLVGIAGVGAQTGSILVMVIFVTTGLVIFSATLGREERFLATRFGPVFQTYLATTPRLLPKPSLWRGEEEIPVKPRNVLRTLRDGCLFLIPFPLFELIKIGQGNDVLPVFIHLPF
jgi:protein-S-isoprenylcysteine O-methyltransferase Ste14